MNREIQRSLNKGREEQHSKSALSDQHLEAFGVFGKCGMIIFRVLFINTVSVEGKCGVRETRQPHGSVTIFFWIWFLFSIITGFNLCHCTLKMWADWDYQVARQQWCCEAPYQWDPASVLVGHQSSPFHRFPVGCHSLTHPSDHQPCLFSRFSCVSHSFFCLYDCTVDIPVPGRCAVILASRSSSSHEHLSKLCSVMTTQQWGNWADPKAKAVRGDWWEGQQGQAILVPPT